MAAYRRIQDWVRQHYDWTPETCWLAHCKEPAGLPRRDAPNRRGQARSAPCPPGKRPPIFRAFRHFGML